MSEFVSATEKAEQVNLPQDTRQQRKNFILNYFSMGIVAVLLALIGTHIYITADYFNSFVSFYGYYNYCVFNLIKLIILLFTLNMYVLFTRRIYNKGRMCCKSKPLSPLSKDQIIFVYTCFIFVIIAFIVDLVIFMNQFMNVSYGPVTVINGGQTQIHWYTDKKSGSTVKTNSKIYSTDELTKFHNVLVDETNFDYQIDGIDANFTYQLPNDINKFIVMTDIHCIDQYTHNMDLDYDFNLLVGDYSYGGLPHEFARTFKNMHQKPVIMAVGNHDALGYHDQLVQREANFYQRIGKLGFYFLFVMKTNNLADCQFVNDSRVDDSIEFLNQNIHLSSQDEHVFIVTHQPMYSTDMYGSHKYFTEQIEAFLDQNQDKKIRAVFSGHDHIFSAFRRGYQYQFINGAAGPIDDMHSILNGNRVWKEDSLSGPLEVKDDRCLGYQQHLDSVMKVTRTEVTFQGNQIQYTIRDLDTNEVFKVYMQDF
ncbi:Alkaline_phosphatase [Hexamita inflata]|uniref:Alkaline phosphatase n=1 Tax=Hexamita inflata TaxID=28002 RepID=A0AA86TW06_9EUKA|nr:Alkaline phosphatase [Hexamita inflata]